MKYEHKVIVAGSRVSFHLSEKFYQFMCSNLLTALSEFNFYEKGETINKDWQISKKLTFISGNASSGADLAIIEFCKEHDINCHLMSAEWNKYGRSAGGIRNKKMADYALEDSKGYLIAFWDGSSAGTKNMIENAMKNYLKIKIFKYEIQQDEFVLVNSSKGL